MTKSSREIYNRPLFAGLWTLDVQTFGRSDVRTFERSNIGRWTLALDVDVGRFTLEVGR